MTRRQEIESIIIGSLLSDYDKYIVDCKCCITPEMFSVKFYQDLYRLMGEINENGSPVDILTIWESGSYNHIQISKMMELITDWCFLAKKVWYNERVYLSSFGNRTPNYTRVTFGDYVTRFINTIFEDERKN